MSAASAQHTPLVRFRNVQKSYDGRQLVVRHLNLDIQEGEFLTLLGPSGSGKTTTLMMLAGFEVPSSGTIELAGEQIDNLPPHKRNIGMVFQNYALFPHMTVAENVAFPLKVRKLDAGAQQEKVRAALTMSDRVAIFHDGVVQQIGSPQDIYERPETAFVAGFIGENNRAHGHITELAARQATVNLDNGLQLKGTLKLGMKVGDRVSVSIRPERIALDPPPDGVDVKCDGKVSEVIYLGDHVRIRMRVPGNADFVVKQPVSQLKRPVSVGDAVTVGWNHEFVRLLDPVEASTSA